MTHRRIETLRRRTAVRLALTTALLVAGLAAGVALAETPNDTQYGNTGSTEPTIVQTTNPAPEVTVESAGAASAPSAAVGQEVEKLPFTGLNIALFFGLGGVLLAAGLFLRRIGRGRADN